MSKAKNPGRRALREILQTVFYNDKTVYAYDDGSRLTAALDRNGELPIEGRWATPAEVARDAFTEYFPGEDISTGRAKRKTR
jgi:hypothetical protein